MKPQASSSNEVALFDKYSRWFDNKFGTNYRPAELLQRRTLNTALYIITSTKNLSFLELSSSIFYASEDVNFKRFTRLYEAQLELAGADPDKFIKSLHAFYNKVTDLIKREDLYSDFFDFISLFGRLRFKRYDQSLASTGSTGSISSIGNVSKEVYNTVVDCYYSLLLQNLEYLRPNKFDFTQTICGITTNGSIMTTRDHYPNIDVPSYIIERNIRENKYASREAINKHLHQLFSIAGYPNVETIEEAEILNNMDRFFINQIAILLPFINEYNYDLLPTNNFNTFVLPFYALTFRNLDINQIIDMLHHRNQMLPSNGVSFELNQNPHGFYKGIIHKVTMKETLYNESIWLIYKAETQMGDVSGVYNTRNSFFYSALQDSEIGEPHQYFKFLILYLYACATTKNGHQLLQDMPTNVYYCYDEYLTDEPELQGHTLPISAAMFRHGGKPQNSYNDSTLNSGASVSVNGKRLNDPRFESSLKPIQGYIRKVGKNKSPSPEAIEYAQSLGLFLAPDETYVRPFVKHVLKLKTKE